MLAWIQRLLALAWLAALLGLPARAVLQGAGLLPALGWAAVVLGAHALWLALTVAMAALANRGDASPRASWRQWLQAWWGEVLTAPRVFFWRQPFRTHAEPDRPDLGAPGQPGVVLLHGFFCNRALWNPWMARLRAERIAFVAPSLEPVFGSIDDAVPLLEAAVQRLERATGVAPLIVAHSMGGLVTRAWLRQAQADGRVRAVLTIGTPHGGTALARLAMSENGRQMQRGGGWLATLSAAEPAERAARFHCIFGHCDNIVFPASTAVLPGAAEVLHLPATAHVDLVDHPASWALAKRLLQS
ncbi:alpha/beta fold hydrolase [Ideonella sp. 4Y16]|uniref:Alpha/beta fold hydrolase n=1 Tax=Ideonella alba TaxID=2824118 RepID=A0A940YG69_9BURK|nr:alpha/beta fold hydrolase [Ideonella alba]MBQ0932726.1 alpha/beta fold hydrolase [Ideonella alba]MBQ0946433.1 alpha/beta fold hydrolase [Ideonella alba]